MKKLLFGLLLVAAAVPAFADGFSYSYEAMRCMRERNCTAGVNRVKITDYHYNDEIVSLLYNLNEMEVEVYESIPQYFVDQYRALYYSDSNRIFLNKEYTSNPGMFIRALRHEGWHAAQDCMGGGMHNSDIMPMLEADKIPPEVVQDTFDRYGFDPTVVRIEREAVLAMDSPWMTVDALEACNSDTPIWEVYYPPQRTWSYLYWHGLVDYQDGI